MQDKAILTNHPYTEHFSIHFVLELEVEEKMLRNNIRISLDYVKSQKDLIQISSNVDEIKSCLSSIERCGQYGEQATLLLEYLNILG